MIKKILLNSGWQMISKAFGVAVSLLITGLLTRKLGANQYGQYIFIFSLLNLLITFANWGTQIIGVRELAKSKNKIKTFGTILGLKLILGTVVIAISAVLTAVLPIFSGLRLIAFLGLAFVLLTTLEISLEIVFQSQIKMGLKAQVNLIYSLVFFAVTYFLINQGLGLISPFIGAILGKIASNLMGTIYANKLISLKINFDTNSIKRLFKETAPMGLLLVLFAAYDQAIDSLVIKKFLGIDQVGYYGLAYRIYANLILPAYFLSNSIFPMISKNPKKYFKNLNKTAFLLIAILVVTVVPTTIIFSKNIIQLIAGPGFLPSVLPLQILAIALIFSYINHINGFSLIAIGRQKASLKIGVVSLVWNLTLNLIFIPKFGINAAALITLSTEALTTLIASLTLASKNKFS